MDKVMKDTEFARLVARDPQVARDYNKRMESWCDAWFAARMPADQFAKIKSPRTGKEEC